MSLIPEKPHKILWLTIPIVWFIADNVLFHSLISGYNWKMYRMIEKTVYLTLLLASLGQVILVLNVCTALLKSKK